MEEQFASRRGERGNVLFLILIAVALFAALSYAVTQSTRSGGGSTEREQSILSGASMTQHPTALRTAIIRMILGGVDVSDLEFNAPADFTGANALTTEAQGVFHPNGGGAVFQSAPADLIDGTGLGTWFYNANFDVEGLGRDGIDGNDITAFLPNVTQAICRQINAEFSIDLTDCAQTVTGVPDIRNAAVTVPLIRVDQVSTGAAFPTNDEENLQGEDDGGTCNAFVGQASGCFADVADPANIEFVFYSVLLER